MGWEYGHFEVAMENGVRTSWFTPHTFLKTNSVDIYPPNYFCLLSVRKKELGDGVWTVWSCNGVRTSYSIYTHYVCNTYPIYPYIPFFYRTMCSNDVWVLTPWFYKKFDCVLWHNGQMLLFLQNFVDNNYTGEHNTKFCRLVFGTG